jgi:hypothetical protein
MAEAVGFFCILDPPSHDEEIARLCDRAGDSLTAIFLNEIRPSRMVHRLPSVQALSAALPFAAKGPVRVFLRSAQAEAMADEQAVLDLQEHAADTIVIFSMRPEGSITRIWKRDEL